MFMFGWDFEVDTCSRFWSWNLIKICVKSYDMNSTLGSVVPLAMFVFFTCLKLHFLIGTKFFINTYLNYQTLVLFMVAKTSADNLSQGFRTELPLTYRLLSPRPSLPISFPCWPPPCSCLLIHRAAARRRFLFKSCFCLRVEINWAPKTNPAITFK